VNGFRGFLVLLRDPLRFRSRFQFRQHLIEIIADGGTLGLWDIGGRFHRGERFPELPSRGHADRFLIVAVPLDEIGGGGHFLGDLSDVLALRIEVHREVGRKETDDDEHDQADALLAVVRPMREGDSGAGQNQQSSHPPNRGLVAFRGLVKALVVNHQFQQPENDKSEHKADDRREQQGRQNAFDLTPIDAIAKPARVFDRIRDRDADERANQGVRT
jgi:hypothetical protein